jgi:replicative DNA helicase
LAGVEQFDPHAGTPLLDPFGDERDNSVRRVVERNAALDRAGFTDRGLRLGGQTILDAPEVIPAIWGSGAEVLWPEGEPTMIAARTSVGKSALAQNLVVTMLGIGPSRVIGWPVKPATGRVLYLAMDRPAQIARSFRRLVGPVDRDTLNDQLIFWHGLLPFRLDGDDTTSLRRFAEALDAGVVIIDSLKDGMGSLTTDEAGMAYNTSVQECVVAGIETLTLHHNRKGGVDGKATRTVDDVYGSTFLTAGHGSVLALDGKPGDLVVTLRQPKSAGDEISPTALRLDLDTGSLEPLASNDLPGWIAARADGATVRDIAELSNDAPTRSDIEKTRRRLNQFTEAGRLTSRLDGQTTRYYATTSRTPK